MRRTRLARPRIGLWSGLVGALALIALLVLGTLWSLLAGSRPQLDGSVSVPGLHAPVRITRDASGVPTLTGADRDDLSYALGYVHAQERFFEMDLMRRLAAGELSELVGTAALPTDLRHRQHRLRAVVDAAWAQLPAAQRHTLELYRDGVNAGLAHLRTRPWEYFLLHVRPQPWRAQDSLLVSAAMYLDLEGDGQNTRELDIARMRAVLPDPLVDFLLASDPDWEAPLQGGLSRRAVLPAAAVFDLRAQSPGAKTEAVALAQAQTPALAGGHPGSNSFAVAGSLTGTGAALLANDMHLGLSVPNIWFRARLRYPDPTARGGEREVSGVTLPGTPVLAVGSNGQVAWGFTNSYGDWLDWVRVMLKPGDPTRYKVPGGWATLVTHDEVIKVKDAPDQRLKVQDTRWGPILAKDTDGTPLALAWIAQHPHSYNLNLMQLERATSANAALDIAPTMGVPPQNLLVADSAGHIGWTIAGNAIPLRTGFNPQQPADWSKSGTGWIGWAGAGRYPRIQNPPNGRLWTANNRTVDGAWLALLGNGGHDLGARAQQIRDDIEAHARLGPGDMLDIQLDDRAVLLTRWQQLLQGTLADNRDSELAQLKRLTAAWQGRAAINSVDYRLVRAFRSAVFRRALAPFAERVQQRFADFHWPHPDEPEYAVWAMVRQQPRNLLDPRYASWQALLLDSARDVVSELGGQPGGLAARTWGEANLTRIDHPMAGALPGWLARYIDMPVQPQPGDHNMPRVAAPAFGASERLAAMPGHAAASLLTMPGGQSDNPLSPYFGAGQQAWLQGRAAPLLPGPTLYTLNLEPDGSR